MIFSWIKFAKRYADDKRSLVLKSKKHYTDNIAKAKQSSFFSLTSSEKQTGGES